MQKSLLTLFCALCALSFIPSSVMATVLFNESFDSRSTGDLTSGSVQDDMGTDQANWWYTTSTVSKLQVASGGLTYSGYKTSSSTNAVSFTGNTNKAIRAFMSSSGYTVPTSAGSKVYMSLLMNVSSLPSTSSDYFISLGSDSRSDLTANKHYLKVCAIKVDDSSFKLGVAKCADSYSASFMNYSDAIDINTTHLLIIEYERVSGDNNDAVKLYINPAKGTPGTPVVTNVDIKNGSGTQMGSSKSPDLAKIFSVYLKPSANTPRMKVDEIRIATSWDDLWEATPTPSVAAPEPEESDVTTSSASISWDAVEDADSYILQWKVNGGDYSDDIEIDKNVRSYSMSDLYSNTKYFVRVKTIIGEDDSDWAEINFTTESYPATLDYKDITFNNWSTIDALPTSGTYYLANNVYEESATTLTGNLNLCLNGKTATLLSNIIIPSGYTLTIYDNEGSGSISGYYESAPLSPAGLITIESGGALVIGEGAIQNLDVDPEDGYSAYAIYNQGTLHMSGNPVITAATADIYLFTSKYITLDGELTNTSKYKVNAAGQVITSGWSIHMSGEKPSDYFASAKSGYRGICVVSNEVKFVKLLALDEEEDNADISDGTYAGTICVSMTRSLTSSQYNTFCLPFALSNAQLEDIFGAGYDLEEFDESSLDGDVLSLSFNKVTALEAGKPYLLQPSVDVANPSFEGVTITATSPVNVTTSYIDFKPVYGTTSLTGGNKNLLFLGADNELFWPESTDYLKGFRAYFEVKGAAAQAAKRARIVKKEDSATGIDQITNDKSPMTNKIIKDNQLLILRDNKTYNVIGQMVK